MFHLNALVIFIVAMSTYVAAGIWYSPAAFGKIWHRESRDPRPYTSSRSLGVLSVGFLFSVMTSVAFANILGPYPTLAYALRMGLYVGFFFLATGFGLHYQITNHSFKLWLIDGGFRVLQFGIFGCLLAWMGIAGFDSLQPAQYVVSPPASSVLNFTHGYGNLPAVLVAAVAGLLLVNAWYSPAVFGKLWLRADAGRQQLRRAQPMRVFGVGLLFSLLAVAAFAKWLGPSPSLSYALEQGALIGFCFLAPGIAINYLCSHHDWKLYWIDGGAQAARFMLYALILGLWR